MLKILKLATLTATLAVVGPVCPAHAEELDQNYDPGPIFNFAQALPEPDATATCKAVLPVAEQEYAKRKSRFDRNASDEKALVSWLKPASDAVEKFTGAVAGDAALQELLKKSKTGAVKPELVKAALQNKLRAVLPETQRDHSALQASIGVRHFDCMSPRKEARLRADLRSCGDERESGFCQNLEKALRPDGNYKDPASLNYCLNFSFTTAKNYSQHRFYWRLPVDARPTGEAFLNARLRGQSSTPDGVFDTTGYNSYHYDGITFAPGALKSPATLESKNEFLKRYLLVNNLNVCVSSKESPGVSDDRLALKAVAGSSGAHGALSLTPAARSAL